MAATAINRSKFEKSQRNGSIGKTHIHKNEALNSFLIILFSFWIVLPMPPIPLVVLKRDTERITDENRFRSTKKEIMRRNLGIPISWVEGYLDDK